MANEAANGEKGKTPDKGRDGLKGKTPDKGRSGVFDTTSTRETGVIVKAAIEAYGAVGDTELTVHVKWPAGTIGIVETSQESASDQSQEGGDQSAEHGAAGTPKAGAAGAQPKAKGGANLSNTATERPARG